jgi:hypothetical protein
VKTYFADTSFPLRFPASEISTISAGLMSRIRRPEQEQDPDD